MENNVLNKPFPDLKAFAATHSAIRENPPYEILVENSVIEEFATISKPILKQIQLGELTMHDEKLKDLVSKLDFKAISTIASNIDDKNLKMLKLPSKKRLQEMPTTFTPATNYLIYENLITKLKNNNIDVTTPEGLTAFEGLVNTFFTKSTATAETYIAADTSTAPDATNSTPKKAKVHYLKIWAAFRKINRENWKNFTQQQKIGLILKTITLDFLVPAFALTGTAIGGAVLYVINAPMENPGADSNHNTDDIWNIPDDIPVDKDDNGNFIPSDPGTGEFKDEEKLALIDAVEGTILQDINSTLPEGAKFEKIDEILAINCISVDDYITASQNKYVKYQISVLFKADNEVYQKLYTADNDFNFEIKKIENDENKANIEKENLSSFNDILKNELATDTLNFMTQQQKEVLDVLKKEDSSLVYVGNCFDYFSAKDECYFAIPAFGVDEKGNSYNKIYAVNMEDVFNEFLMAEEGNEYFYNQIVRNESMENKFTLFESQTDANLPNINDGFNNILNYINMTKKELDKNTSGWKIPNNTNSRQNFAGIANKRPYSNATYAKCPRNYVKE